MYLNNCKNIWDKDAADVDPEIASGALEVNHCGCQHVVLNNQNIPSKLLQGASARLLHLL